MTVEATWAGALPAAVMWDMDGTLVDTEPYWIAEEHRLVTDHGGVWTDEHAHQLVANGAGTVAPFLGESGVMPLAPRAGAAVANRAPVATTPASERRVIGQP